MLIKNQKVTVKWNGANIPWFKSKGYPFTKRFDKFQVDVEDLSPGSVEYVLVECDVCHKTYYKQYKNHLIAMNNGGDFCTKCKGIKTSTTTKNKHRDSTWNKIQYAAKQMDYEIITPYSKINSTHDKITYKCKIHGEQKSCINNFVNLHGCNQCALLIRKNKTKNDIDFYLPRYNLCIEFDGEQHFNDHMYKTRCINNPNIHLQYTQRHDRIKNQYCQNNHIHLLRIPYYKENHIEELINNKIIEIS